MTKYGNRKVRAALFMPAMVALRRGYLPDLVQRLKNRKNRLWLYSVPLCASWPS
ncbi:hypothetical protein [Neisseria musculi]|uniref:hypothetical protein n=1 Tax=Neisseria musculi TaxID=1815583 RepID=UPI00336C119D